jgi:hypothetical protein
MTDIQGVTNRDVNAANRAVMAVQLRAQMLTYEEIAKRAGFANAGTCRKAIMRELDRTIVKKVDELRLQELSMLNQLHDEIWQLFINKANKGRLFAADRILAISERRSKLMGLDIKADEAISANMVVIREVPNGYLGEVKSE